MVVARLSNNSTVYVEMTEEANGNYFCVVYFDALKKEYIDCFTLLKSKVKDRADAIKKAQIRCKMIGK